MRKYFSNPASFINAPLILDWDNPSWCAYFFAEVSALAYHDGTKAKKELKAIGFNSYKFLENDGAQCHIFNNSEHLVIAFRGTEPTQWQDIKADLDDLANITKIKDKYAFIKVRKAALDKIGELEEYFLPSKFPYKIPSEFDDLPRLLGRANVKISTTKGDMEAIIDGYNAPLTGGAFIDLASKDFYNDLPINRAEEFFVLQTGDPKGNDIGYVDPETNEQRLVPLEIRVPGEPETFYNETFEDLGFYTETPTLPFATLGTLGWSHSSEAVDDGSSQFFFFLYEAELNPAGRNLIDGRNAAFGYVVNGADILEELNMDDKIISIKITEGEENLKAHA